MVVCRPLTRACGKCETYLRLASDLLAQSNETDLDYVDIDAILDFDQTKLYGAMGVAKTIGTVSWSCSGRWRWQ